MVFIDDTKRAILTAVKTFPGADTVTISGKLAMGIQQTEKEVKALIELGYISKGNHGALTFIKESE